VRQRPAGHPAALQQRRQQTRCCLQQQQQQQQHKVRELARLCLATDGVLFGQLLILEVLGTYVAAAAAATRHGAGGSGHWHGYGWCRTGNCSPASGCCPLMHAGILIV
jgi:hypothetical protein